MPEGFMQNSAVGSINSGVANAISADSLLNVYAELKTGYNGTYLLNRKTLNSVRKLKDATGQYLWVPGIAAGMPNTINGRPYIETPDMPDEGANTYPVIYGDFLRSYTIVDGMDMGLIRDNLTLATQAMVKYVLMKSTGGKVTLPEGLKKIKCST
jgi:HK97 family phage major capsid protein